MSKDNDTSRQHFVPQFYLRLFANDEGLIERLDLPTVQVLSKAVSPKSECHDEYFYAIKTGKKDDISQEVEKFWKIIEDYTSERIENVTQKILNYAELSDEDVNVIANLGAMLWMRTPFFRETINKMSETSTKMMMRLRASHPDFVDMTLERLQSEGIETTRQEVEEIRDIWLSEEYDLSFSNTSHLKFSLGEFEGFRNLFYYGKWRFYIAGGEKKFITSTSPCIEVIPEADGWFDRHFYARTHFLPLSPNVSASLHADNEPGKLVKRQRIDDHKVMELNLQQANCSYPKSKEFSRCYGSRKNELNDLAAQYHRRQKQIRDGSIVSQAVKQTIQEGL